MTGAQKRVQDLITKHGEVWSFDAPRGRVALVIAVPGTAAVFEVIDVVNSSTLWQLKALGIIRQAPWAEHVTLNIVRNVPARSNAERRRGSERRHVDARRVTLMREAAPS